MTRTCGHLLVTFIALIALAACGGGGGSGGGGASNGSGWVAGVFAPARAFEAQCASPRTGRDPLTGSPYPDQKGSSLTENNWLRSWSNDLYLWYDEIADRDPGAYSTPSYFALLKTTATTPSGKAKDRFHFTLPTAEWEQLAQSGVSAGYGATWAIVASTPPRQIVIAYTDPNTPATNLSPPLARGASVLEVDGADAVNGSTQADVDKINAGLFPAAAGESHTFSILDLGASTPRAITLRSEDIQSAPVQNVHAIATGSGQVGYLLFNDHLATAEQALIDAVNDLKTAGIADLVLDIRYNGGGYLDIANELAYMIAGAARTTGKAFESTRFNAKHPTTDPVTGDALAPLPFHTRTQGFSAPSGQPLPTLNLARVYVLTGANTCSASESIINALQGIDVEVIQIGSTTCGKPYGFYPQDNCGTTYFTVEFKGENNKGFGDYPDGFSPANTVSNAGAAVTGCSVGDDFAHALGDPAERRLAAALAYRQTTLCPAPSGIVAPGTAELSTAEATDGVIRKPEWLTNRILRR
jgi:carboxyl-terminal processing protease